MFPDQWQVLLLCEIGDKKRKKKPESVIALFADTLAQLAIFFIEIDEKYCQLISLYVYVTEA